jgi:hypothetical protein
MLRRGLAEACSCTGNILTIAVVLSPPHAMSPYRVAIDYTSRTIEARARNHRNLVVAVVLLALATIIMAGVNRSIVPLAALCLLVPLCGVFFLLDARLLDEWRCRVLEAWVTRDIDLEPFRGAVSAAPALPNETLQSMLATLPDTRGVVREHDIASSTREGVATASRGVHACQRHALALRTLAAATVASCVVLGLASRWWGAAAFALIAVLVTRGIGVLRRRQCINDLKASAAEASRKEGFNAQRFAELIGRLPWEPLTPSAQNAVLAVVRSASDGERPGNRGAPRNARHTR